MYKRQITGGILGRYEAAIAAMPLLVTFIPMLPDTGGNAGSQSSTCLLYTSHKRATAPSAAKKPAQYTAPRLASSAHSSVPSTAALYANASSVETAAQGVSCGKASPLTH